MLPESIENKNKGRLKIFGRPFSIPIYTVCEYLALVSFMAQMVVEHHGDVADQETALRRNSQAVRFETDQSEGFQLLHIFQFGCKIAAKRNAEHAFIKFDNQARSGTSNLE